MKTPKQSYIENEVREALGTVNQYLQSHGARTIIREEDIPNIALEFKPDTTKSLSFYIEDSDKIDPYFIGKNVGRVFFGYFNPRFERLKYISGEAAKICLVVYHLFGILNVVRQDPNADIDSFTEKYESARETYPWITLRETMGEKMERLTGMPIDFPETQQEDDGGKEDFVEESENPIWEIGSSGVSDPEAHKIDDFVDPEADARREYLEKRRKDKEFDPNQETDFGFGGDISDFGYQQDEVDRRIREQVDSVKFDGLANDRLSKMPEEFQVARAIFLGRIGEKNWQTVLENLLTSDEQTSMRYLKSIYNY